MATSGTFLFAPSTGEVVLSAFARLQIRRPEILAEHLINARMETNFLLVEWANLQVNLWEVDLQTVSLVQGTATYTVPADTVMILDAYVTPSGATDRLIFPISRSEYASYPDKTIQNTPSVFWFDRLGAADNHVVGRARRWHDHAKLLSLPAYAGRTAYAGATA